MTQHRFVVTKETEEEFTAWLTDIQDDEEFADFAFDKTDVENGAKIIASTDVDFSQCCSSAQPTFEALMGLDRICDNGSSVSDVFQHIFELGFKTALDMLSSAKERK